MRSLAICLFTLLIVQITQAQEKVLLIASGGGVAGTATVYKIDTNGTVHKGKGLGEIVYSEQSKLKKCTTRKYFKKATSLMNTYPDFNHPGNLYTTISLKDNENEKKVTWGAADHKAPEEAKKLHDKIITKLSQITFTSDPRK